MSSRILTLSATLLISSKAQPFLTPVPTPAPTSTFRGYDEYETYTKSCSHVKCERERGGYIKVYHSKFEEYGHKHVCSHGLHVEGKCGCECYDEGEGEENVWEHLLSSKALEIVRNSSASVCKVKKYGACWFLSKQGQSCRDTCSWRGRSFVDGVYAPPTTPVMKYLLGREPFYKRTPRYVQECYIKNPANPLKDQYFPAMEGGYGAQIPEEGWETGAGYTDVRQKVQDFASASCQLACPCSLREHEAHEKFTGGRKSCTEWLDDGYTDDGEYMICPAPGNCFHVWCDMTNEGGGWTLVLSRGDVGFDYNRAYPISGVPNAEGVADIVKPMEAQGKTLGPRQWAALKQLSTEFAFHVEGGKCGANRTTYRKIHHGCIHGHDYKVIPQLTVKQCEAECTNDPKCRAFEYGLNRPATKHPTAAPTKVPTTGQPTYAPTPGPACDPLEVRFANASSPDEISVAELALKQKVVHILGTYDLLTGIIKNSRPVYKLQDETQNLYLYSFFRTSEFRNVWLIARDYTQDAIFESGSVNQGFAQAKSDAINPEEITAVWDYFDPDAGANGELVAAPGHELFLETICQVPPTPAPTPLQWTSNPTPAPTLSPTWSKPMDCRLQDSTDNDGCYGMQPISLDLYIREEGYSFQPMLPDTHCEHSGSVTAEVLSEDLCHDFAVDTAKTSAGKWDAVVFHPNQECSVTQNLTCNFGSFGGGMATNGTCDEPSAATGTSSFVQVGSSGAEIIVNYDTPVIIDTFSTLIHPGSKLTNGVAQVQVACLVGGVWEERGTFAVLDSYFNVDTHWKTFKKSFPQCVTNKVKLHGLAPKGGDSVGYTTLYDVQVSYGDDLCAKPGGSCTVYKECNAVPDTEADGYELHKADTTCGASQFSHDEISLMHRMGVPRNMSQGSFVSGLSLVTCADLCNELLGCQYFAFGSDECYVYKQCEAEDEVTDATVAGFQTFARVCDWSKPISDVVLDCGAIPPSGACQEAWWSTTQGSYTLEECKDWCAASANCTGISYGEFKQHCRLGMHGPKSPRAGESFWELWGQAGSSDCSITSICAASYYKTYTYDSTKEHCQLERKAKWETMIELGKGAWGVGELKNLVGEDGKYSNAHQMCAALGNDLTRCNLVQGGRGTKNPTLSPTPAPTEVGFVGLGEPSKAPTPSPTFSQQCGAYGTDFNAAFGISDAHSPVSYLNSERCTYFSNAASLADGKDPLWTGAPCTDEGTFVEKADLYVRSRIPKSCKEYLNFGRTDSGQYLICPYSQKQCFAVYCDMERGGGGWTLVMSRGDVLLNPAHQPHTTNLYISPGLGDGSTLTAARWQSIHQISSEFAFAVSGNDVITGSDCAGANAAQNFGTGYLHTLNATNGGTGTVCSLFGDDLTKCDLSHVEADGCNYQGADYSSIFGRDIDPLDAPLPRNTQARCTYFSQRFVSLWTGADCISNDNGMFATSADLYVR